MTKMFQTGRIVQLLMLLVTVISSYYWFNRAEKAKTRNDLPMIRRISGLEAIDEAVGRSTEMGRPIHFSMGVPRRGGLASIEAAEIMASLGIISYVSRKAAELGPDFILTLAYAQLVPIAEDTVKNAYILAGRSEEYKPENIRYLSDQQFAYASGVIGVLFRERVASNFLMGPWFATSMLLSEMGAQAGAMQIAGTASMNQVQFLVAACDYTLIGEEFFAAGAYLSEDLMRISNIIAQDYVKILFVAIMILGLVFSSAGSGWLSNLLSM